MKEKAKSVLGTMVKTRRGLVNPDPQIQRLSMQQRLLRLRLEDGSLDDEGKRRARGERNRISHQIRRRCLDNANSQLDRAAEAIERAPDSIKMYQATSVFRREKQKKIIVESVDGLVLDRDVDRADRVRDHFSTLLCNPTPTNHVTTPEGLATPLSNPVAVHEMEAALSRMNNQKAAGPDGVPAELLKYGKGYLSPLIVGLINTAVTNNQDIMRYYRKSLDLAY